MNWRDELQSLEDIYCWLQSASTNGQLQFLDKWDRIEYECYVEMLREFLSKFKITVDIVDALKIDREK